MEAKKFVLITSILYIIAVVILILAYSANYIKLKEKYNEALNELNYYHNIDTAAIHKIDSIEYNIRQKDSIIYNIKTEFINEIEIIKANNDIDAVNQFKQLVESD